MSAPPVNEARREAAGPDRVAVAGANGTVTLIERAFVLLLIGGLLLGVLAVLWPFGTAILFATVLAIATWPLRTAMVRRGVSRGLAATLMCLAALLVVGLPALVAAPRLTAQVSGLNANVAAAFNALPDSPPGWLSGLPVVGARATGVWAAVAAAEGDLYTLLAPYAETLRRGVVAAASALAESALEFLLSIIVAGMLWARGDAVQEALRDVALRLGGDAAVGALETASGALRGVAYGVVGTALIQGLLMATGAWIAGVPGAVLLGFLVLLLAISQVGAILLPLVWGGAGWWLFQRDESGWGVFMLVWGFLLVTMSDNVLRPWLISRGLTMPMTLVILGVFGGFVSLGFLGLFVGPALLAVAFTLLQAWRGQLPATFES
ncbi:AI-2E family transporter [Sabulicella rubraurantiaca]|uniref:AI-2E family transporter n=1 Tax=Sabulicella rubraurantiaca TaxID=2811429 RepID=UPI001A96067E|nr:AI-2E family transporter [Sabulicella rubraurantiaca]